MSSNLFVQSAFLFSSCINLLPVLGVLGSKKLSQLYGVTITEMNQEMMMKHRAILFGIVGSILGVAIVHRPIRKIAYFAGLTSMSSYMFLVTVFSDQGLHAFTSEIQRVFWIDCVGVLWLGTAAIVDIFGSLKRDSEAKKK